MVKQKKKFSFLKFLVCISLVLMNFIVSMPNLTRLSFAFASDSTTYSNVLDDLQKDENFKVESYPLFEDDYSLEVIQIAESVDNELFVYVYEPNGGKDNVIASSINISTGIDDNLSYKNYKLQLLNNSETLFKFKVVDFELPKGNLRYYDISSIFRPWIAGVDAEAGYGNTISEVSFEVAQQWQAYSYNDKVLYQCLETETIVVTDKYVGFVRYPDGYHILNHDHAFDSHFIAFNTDKDIEKLYEADVEFISQEQLVSLGLGGHDRLESAGEKINHVVCLKASDVVDYQAGGWFGHKYNWDRIQLVSDFVKDNDTMKKTYECGLFDVVTESKLTEDGKASLSGKKWLLRFFESDYSTGGFVVGGKDYFKRTIVGEVTILRLKFETDGVVYNLGVVDNKQTGDGIPDNETTTKAKPSDWVIVALIILGVILFVLLMCFVEPFAKFIWFIVKWTGKILWYILLGIWYFFTWPFYLIYKKKGGGS